MDDPSRPRVTRSISALLHAPRSQTLQHQRVIPARLLRLQHHRYSGWSHILPSIFKVTGLACGTDCCGDGDITKWGLSIELALG